MTISLTTINTCREIIEDLLQRMGLTAEISIRATEEFIYVDIHADESGILIGYHGETLSALQTITGLMLSRKTGQRVHLIVDVDGYRERRETALTNMAKRAAEEVMLSRKSITLEPMQPFERRIVHMILQGYPEVRSESEGYEPERRIVIYPV